MDKRGIFVLLILLFSLVSAGYVFGVIGDSCTQYRPCDAGEGCVSGQCVSTSHTGYCGRGYQCSEDGIRCFRTTTFTLGTPYKYCADGRYCDPVLDSCLYLRALGDDCSYDFGCESGNCNNGRCEDKVFIVKCLENQELVNGRCVGVLDIGEPCNENYECSSKICNELTSDLKLFKTTGAATLITSPILRDLESIYTGKVCVDNTNWIGICPEDLSCISGGNACYNTTTLRICRNNYYCNSDANGCVAKKLDGVTCTGDIECRSGDCYTGEYTTNLITGAATILGTASPLDTRSLDLASEEGVCISENYWVGECGRDYPTCSADKTKCKASKTSLADDITCATGFYCGPSPISSSLSLTSNPPACIPAKEEGTKCSVDAECISYNCIDEICGGCSSDGDCPENYLCREDNTCKLSECATTSDCPIGGSCIRGSCQKVLCTTDTDCIAGGTCNGEFCAASATPPSPLPGTTGTECREISDCEGDLVCVLDVGEGGTCEASPDTPADIDGDGIIDSEDPCVGSTLDECTETDLGLSCADAEGIVCGENEQCKGGAESPSTTELNCCVPLTTGDEEPYCESSLYLPVQNTNVVFVKSCTATGRMEVTVKYSDNTQLYINNPDDLEILNQLGITSNPYIDQTDYSCSDVLEGETSKQEIPAYGLISLLVTLGIISLFYSSRVNKRFK